VDGLIGYPLKEALNILENKNKIINIIKVTGSNKKFNNLNRPYVIRENYCDNTITLYISYY
jgi:hypothetical protein